MAFLGAPIVAAIADKVVGIIDKLIPDTAARDKMKAEMTQELMRQDWQGVMAQLDINKQEAAHDSVFVAGWRPAVGWVCAASFAYTFVLQPFLVFVLTALKWQAPPLPELDMGPLLAVLGGILGLGGMRTYEKVKGAPAGK